VTTWLRTAGESLAGSFGGIVEQTDAIWESGRDSGLSDSQILHVRNKAIAESARSLHETWMKRSLGSTAAGAPHGPPSELAPGTSVATAASIEIAKRATAAPDQHRPVGASDGNDYAPNTTIPLSIVFPSPTSSATSRFTRGI
jgi:hypothetical protein